MAVDGEEENELAILEFIHSLVETMDKYFESVCELDVSSIQFILDATLSMTERKHFQCFYHPDYVSHREGPLHCG